MSKPTRRWATVRFTFEGWHRWERAPVHRAYLRAEHRHLFHVEVSLATHHDDREVEFHDLLVACREVVDGWVTENLGESSCEQMASALHDEVAHRWPDRATRASVFEDGEVGATLEWEV